MGGGWLTVPRDWIESVGEISRFCAMVTGQVYSGRVGKYFGEALKQAGILILGSTAVIFGMVFTIGLTCGIEGAYFNRSVGAPAYAGVFAAWCDLREAIPYAFGYMMSAKVGTGIVAELGAMRISDEIDALEVMGVPPVTFLAATMGKDALFPARDDLARVNVMAYREGEALNWHFDRSEFTTTLLLQAPDQGGEFIYRSDLRSDSDPNYDGVARLLRGEDPEVKSLNLTAGTLNVFRGKNTAHKVGTVKGARERMIAVFAYFDRPGVVYSREDQMGFYGRTS